MILLFFWFEAILIFGFAGLKISTLRLKWFKSTSKAFNISMALPLPSLKSPSIKCSVPIKSCPSRRLKWDEKPLILTDEISILACFEKFVKLN